MVHNGVVSLWCPAAFSCVCVLVLPDLCDDGAMVRWRAGEKVGCYGLVSLWLVGKGLCRFFCCSVVALM